jgi:hypothetical protein
MIPSRENAQKFILSSHFFARVAFQLYSYPIAFSNTILRNAIRDMYMTRGAAVPKHLAGGALMYFATGFTQRMKGINEVDDEPIDQLIKTLTTMGVAGPFDLVHNFQEAISYGSNTPRAMLRLMGPTLGGMLADSLQGDTPFSSALFKNTMPYRNLIRRLSPETIHELDEFLKDIERRAQGKGTYTRGKARREADKRFAQKEMRAKQRPAKQKIKEAREKLATGGKLSVDYPVPFVKDNPTERKIDNTNQSFAIVSRLFEEEDRVPFSFGGKLANKLIKTNLFKKKAGWKWTKVPEGFDPNPDGQFPLVSVETGGKHLYSLQADFPEGVLLERYAKQKSEPRLRPTTKGVVRTGNKIGEIKTSSGKLHPVYDNIVAVDEKTKAVKGLKDMPTNVMPAPQRFFDPEDKGYKPFLSNFDYIKGGRYVEINKEGNKDVTGTIPQQARISIGPEGKASFTISREFYDSLFAESITKSSSDKTSSISSIDKARIKKNEKKFRGSLLSKMSEGVDDSLSAREKFISEDIYKPFNIGSKFTTSQFGNKKIYEVVDFVVRRVADRKSNARVPGLLIRTVKDDLLASDPKDVRFMYLYKDPTSKNPTQGIFDFLNKDKDYVKFLTGPKDIK